MVSIIFPENNGFFRILISSDTRGRSFQFNMPPRNFQKMWRVFDFLGLSIYETCSSKELAQKSMEEAIADADCSDSSILGMQT